MDCLRRLGSDVRRLLQVNLQKQRNNLIESIWIKYSVHTSSCVQCNARWFLCISCAMPQRACIIYMCANNCKTMRLFLIITKKKNHFQYSSIQTITEKTSGAIFQLISGAHAAQTHPRIGTTYTLPNEIVSAILYIYIYTAKDIRNLSRTESSTPARVN